MSPSTSNILIFLLSLTIQQIAAFAPQAKAMTTTTTTTARSTRLAFSPYDDDPVLRLPLMEAQLATSNGRDLDLVATIEDAKTAAEFSVRRAQVEFYEAFATQSIELMTKVWSTEYYCRCIHPGSPANDGRESVLSSWAQIFTSAQAFHVEPNPGAHIEICGNTAICTCVEQMNGGGELEVVNIFKRERGNWRITLHMASPIVRS
jgi:hypothetical protein